MTRMDATATTTGHRPTMFSQFLPVALLKVLPEQNFRVRGSQIFIRALEILKRDEGLQKCACLVVSDAARIVPN